MEKKISKMDNIVNLKLKDSNWQVKLKTCKYLYILLYSTSSI